MFHCIFLWCNVGEKQLLSLPCCTSFWYISKNNPFYSILWHITRGNYWIIKRAKYLAFDLLWCAKGKFYKNRKSYVRIPYINFLLSAFTWLLTWLEHQSYAYSYDYDIIITINHITWLGGLSISTNDIYSSKLFFSPLNLCFKFPRIWDTLVTVGECLPKNTGSQTFIVNWLIAFDTSLRLIKTDIWLRPSQNTK